MDAEDTSLGSERSMKKGNLSVGQLMKKFPDIAPLFDKHRDMMIKHGDFQSVINFHEFLQVPMPKDIEKRIVDNPKAASYYAANVLKKRWPEAEPYIIKSDDPKDLETYIKGVGRVPDLEKSFVKEAKAARSIVEQEKLMRNMITYATLVNEKVPQTHVPPIEEAILLLKDENLRAMAAGEYATKIKDRFPEAEEIIGEHEFWGFIYDRTFKTDIWNKGKLAK